MQEARVRPGYLVWGWMMVIAGMFVFPARAAIWGMEAGEAVMQVAAPAPTFTYVAFRQAYSETPLVFLLPTSDEGEPAGLRIKNVTTSGFEVVQVEPPGSSGGGAAATVHYLAVEPGDHSLPDGKRLLAGAIATKKVQTKLAIPDRKGWETVSWGGKFTAVPAVVGQVQTMNNESGSPPASPSKPWLTTAISSVDAAKMKLAIERSEVNDGSVTNDETVGYVAMAGGDKGSFTDNGGNTVSYEAIRSSDNIPGWNDGCRTVNFSNAYAAAPLVVADKNTRDGADGGWLRRCSLGNGNVGLTVDEDVDSDAERSHTPERAGILVFSRSFSLNYGGFKMEADSVSLAATSAPALAAFVTIPFKQTYTAPPLVFTLPTNEGSQPAAIRIKNVTTTTFDAAPVEPPGSGGGHSGMTFHYLAVEAGNHTLPDGDRIYAGVISSKLYQSGRGGSTGWETITWGTPFANAPPVLGQIQTMNNESGTPPTGESIPWLTAAIRVVGSGSANMALERAEVDNGSVVQNETIAFFAIADKASGTFSDNGANTIAYEAIRSADSIVGWTDGCAAVPFAGTYGASPLVLASQNTRDGANGGWARRCSLSKSAVGLTIDEDQDMDAERSHTSERAGLVIFSQAFAATFSEATANCESLPTDFAAHGGGGLDLKSKFTVNGNDPNGSGNTLYETGNRANLTPNLPYFEPQTFPNNSSNTDFTAPTSGSTLAAGYYDDVVVSNSASLTFTSNGGEYHIDKLDVKKSATITFAPGTYFIEELLIGQSATLTISPAGDVRVFVKDGAVFDDSSRINTGGEVGEFIVFLYEDADADVKNSAYFKGVIYSPYSDSDVVVDNSATVQGMIMVGGELEFKNSSKLLLSTEDLNTVSGTTLCLAAGSDLDHFSLSHDGSGINCQPEPVTLLAHKSDHSTYVDFTGTVSLSTNTGNGDWSLITGSGTFDNGTADDGNATYTFAASDQGIAIFSLADTHAETVNINLSAGSVTEDPSEDNPIIFAKAGFNFLADTVINNIGTQIAGKPSTSDPGAQVLVLQAVNTNDDTGACEGLFTGVTDVSLAFTCNTPASCSGQPVSINGVGITGNAWGTSPLSYTTVSLDFGGGGDSAAAFFLSYADVGLIQLHAQSILSPSLEKVSGASNAFVVRPFGFSVTPQGANAFASDENGTAYKRAGEAFSTTISAVSWQSSDDADSDGVPDGSANLSDNAITPSFGQEGETVDLSNTLVGPLGGNNPALGGTVSGIGGCVGGSASTSLSWNEVGIINIAAGLTDGNYLGSGQTVIGAANNVGRFYPASLSITGITQTPAGGTFTYAGISGEKTGQPFAIDATLTALALDGLTTTENYAGNYAKLTSGDISASAWLSPGVNGAGTLGFNAGSVLFTNGVANISASATYDFAAIAAPETLYMGLAASDSDGVSGSGDNPADIQSFRLGRLAMDNAHGSELLPLQVPLRAEYWDGAGWMIHGGDGMTAFNVSPDVCLPDPDAETVGSCLDTFKENLAAGETTLSGSGTLVSGRATLSLTAPGDGNQGSAVLKLGVPSWLKFNWDGADTAVDNPASTITFGIYKGPAGIIYQREVY